MIAFDKPSGLLTAPDRTAKKGGNLMRLVQKEMGPDVVNVHRLDADTSGIVLCAKNKIALDFLSGQFQSKTAGQKHLAISILLPVERAMKLTTVIVPREVDGCLPESFTIDLGLGEDELQPDRMRICRKHGGKESITEVRSLERHGRYTLYECQPLTGRMHQIRLHLAAAGSPVINDRIYGDPTERLLLSNLKRGYKSSGHEKPLINRLALHAAELTVKHPNTREPVVISAPLPEDFEIAMKYLRKFAGSKRR